MLVEPGEFCFNQSLFLYVAFKRLSKSIFILDYQGCFLPLNLKFFWMNVNSDQKTAHPIFTFSFFSSNIWVTKMNNNSNLSYNILFWSLLLYLTLGITLGMIFSKAYRQAKEKAGIFFSDINLYQNSLVCFRKAPIFPVTLKWHSSFTGYNKKNGPLTKIW